MHGSACPITINMDTVQFVLADQIQNAYMLGEARRLSI